jgi:hypothetical protein
MKITQLSILLENRPHCLKEIVELLNEHQIKLVAVTIAESKEYDVLRLVVDRAPDALHLLNNHGWRAEFSEVAAVEVSDEHGGLAHILKVLCDNDLEIEYMYGFMEQRSDKALIIFRFNDLNRAIEALTQNGVKLISSPIG